MPRAALSSVLAACLAAAPLAAQTEDAWDQGYDQVRALMQKSKWSEARTALLALLGQNAGKPYVLADKQSVIADHQQCSFWCEAKVPKPQDLLSGKVESHDPASGRIKLRYAADSMSDWNDSRLGLIHPMVFAGAFSITVTDPAYPESSFAFLYDIGSTGYCRADLGGGKDKPRVRRIEGEKETVLDQKDGAPFAAGKPFSARLEVTNATVTVLVDKKPLLQHKRQAGDGGFFGLTTGGLADVVLEGQMEPSWFQNAVDEQLAKQREEYGDSYQAEAVLPKWLFADLPSEKVPSRHDFDDKRAKSPEGEELFTLLAGNDLPAALKKLDQLGDADLAAADRTYLRALILQRAGDAEKALAPAEAAVKATPEATYARVLLAQVLTDLRRPQEALPLLQQAHTADPGNETALTALFVALLRRSDVRGAERLVREAKVKHGMWTEAFDLDRMLAMRRRGPAWPRHFRQQSAHYEVHTDIDAKTASEAVQVLEELYGALQAQLAAVVDKKDAPLFPVYLFSGESGYQEYNSHILGAPVPHSAGLYSPVLKQLLIWNVPKREDMVQTIRHEGFHQFLDRVMQDPPVWFNEGMAEFWEAAQKENGKLVGGQVRSTHVATLLRSRKAIPKLKDFVYGSRADFYANAQQRYAQGWALVHWLRRGPPEGQRIFDTLWASLRGSEGSTRAALDKAFAGVDWDKLDAGWWAWVDKMATAK